MIKKVCYVITFLFTIILLRIFFFEIYTINQNSMNKTYHTGDRVLILKNFYSIRHNDVVIFQKDHNNMIKRCLGLPGENIEIINGKIYSNKSLLPNPPSIIHNNIFKKDAFSISEISHTYGKKWNLNNFGSYLIPKKGMNILLTSENIVIYGKLIEEDNHNEMPDLKRTYYTFKNNYFFFIGDNRPESVDSRFFGPIKESDINGKVILDIFKS